MKRSLLIAAVAAAAAATACVSASQAAKTSVPACPAHAPKASTFDADVFRDFVGPGASASRLCLYSNINWGGNSQGLLRQRLTRDGVTVASLTRAFDKLRQPPPHGVFNCPMDDGSELLVLFAYPQGGVVERVVVKLSGCHFASNGGPAQQVRWTTLRLRRRLLNLVKRR